MNELLNVCAYALYVGSSWSMNISGEGEKLKVMVWMRCCDL